MDADDDGRYLMTDPELIKCVFCIKFLVLGLTTPLSTLFELYVIWTKELRQEGSHLTNLDQSHGFQGQHKYVLLFSYPTNLLTPAWLAKGIWRLDT